MARDFPKNSTITTSYNQNLHQVIQLNLAQIPDKQNNYRLHKHEEQKINIKNNNYNNNKFLNALFDIVSSIPSKNQ